MEIYNLQVNHVNEPVGYLFDEIIISFKFKNVKGKTLKNAKVEIALKEDFQSIIYTEEHANPLATKINLKLKPYTRYFYKVSAISDEEDYGEAVSFFETAKMGEKWEASFIESVNNERKPIFFKNFTLAKKVKKARLYITGLGLYHATINNKEVTDEKFTPFCNDYSNFVQYQTYDVTSLLEKENIIEVLAGEGWYASRFGFSSRQGQKGFYGNTLKMIMELHVEYEDNSKEVIVSDDSFKIKRSRMVFTSIYDGEQTDDTLEDLPEENAVISSEKVNLTERVSVPVKVHETIKPIALLTTPKNEKVFDIGQNLAGSFVLHIKASKGTKITIKTGEVLQDGCFYNGNLRTAKSEYIYISDGVEKDISPMFTFYGFRYVMVEGLDNLSKDSLTALAIYSEIFPIGNLVTQNEKINQLISNVKWGQKGNFLDVPTDCPQRDERMGWTGDAQVFAPTAMFLTDAYAFYNKFMYDLSLVSEKRNGKVCDVIPPFGVESFSCGWGDCVALIPWTIYQYTGDKTILSKYLKSMTGWADFIKSIDKDSHGYRKIFHYGDWLALDNPSGSADETRGGTEEGYIADVYHLQTCEIILKSARILNDEKVAEEYEKEVKRLRKEISDEYFTSTGRCAISTQTGYLLALKHNLTSDRSKVTGQLLSNLEASGGKLKTGFIGTPFLLDELSKAGYDDKAYNLLLNESYPGWLHEVNLGATTIWERWNSLDENGKISSTGMNSLNHYSYGSVLNWMFNNIGGITPLKPGFGEVRIAPKVNNDIKGATMEYDSASGLYKVFWEILPENNIHVKVSVPFHAKATLKLPYSDEKEILLDAGEYEYTYKANEEICKILTVDSKISELMANFKLSEKLKAVGFDLARFPSALRGMTMRQVSERYLHDDTKLNQLNQLILSVQK